MVDLMDLALDAMERGDWEEGNRLAAESNRQLAASIEFRHKHLNPRMVIKSEAEPQQDKPSDAS